MYALVKENGIGTKVKVIEVEHITDRENGKQYSADTELLGIISSVGECNIEEIKLLIEASDADEL